MGYLYGDSTPSAIDIDYIDFLSKAIDFCVEALLCEHRILGHEEAANLVRDEAAERRAGLQRVAALVHDALEELARAPGDEPATRCANTVDRLAAQEVRAEVERLDAGLATRLEHIEELVQRERDAVVRALEPLVLAYDLPESEREVRLKHDGSAGYAAVLAATTPYGAKLTIELDTTESEALAKELRAGQLVDGISIHAPQAPGLLRKRARIVARSVARHLVTRAVVGTERVHVELRSSVDEDADGFDIDLDRANRTAALAAVDKDGGPETFLTEPEDLDALMRLGDALVTIAETLAQRRRALHTATLDDAALAACSRPSLLVERVLAVMAPIVAEIETHSVTDGELVLRKPVDEGRREEIFVAKADLAAKLAPLPRSLRPFFEVLGLAGGSTESIGSDMIVEIEEPPPIPGEPVQDGDDGVPIDEEAELESAGDPSIEIVQAEAEDPEYAEAVSGELEPPAEHSESSRRRRAPSASG